MEIYRNRPATVRIEAPVPGAVYNTVKVSSVSGESEVAPTYVDNYILWNAPALEIPIEFKHTWYDGTVTLDINVNDGTGEHSYEEYVEVVTPLFTAADLPREYPAEKVPELESLVRKVVEAYTGQSFGPTIRQYNTEFGENILRFDAPLIEFRGVSARYLTHTTTLSPPKVRYETLDDGFKAVVDLDLYDPKTDSMWILNQNKHRSMTFEGVFGYNRVPQDVKRAALLIAGTWSDDQAVWRDRFIETMRSADWTVSYHENAFASTGSATADMLLKKYHRRAVPEVL